MKEQIIADVLSKLSGISTNVQHECDTRRQADTAVSIIFHRHSHGLDVWVRYVSVTVRGETPYCYEVDYLTLNYDTGEKLSQNHDVRYEAKDYARLCKDIIRYIKSGHFKSS